MPSQLSLFGRLVAAQPGLELLAILASPLVDRREAARLDILRALERGDLDLETASHRLEILEESGPRFFRGWC